MVYNKPSEMDSNSVHLRSLVYAALFGALTAIGAFISIPLYPVPLTLQDMFMTLAGLLLGAYLGALSQIVYVLLGIMGLPVFAGGKAGLGVLLGPTGGYLLGFVAGACVIGGIGQAKKAPGWAWLLLAIVAGHAVMYAVGAVQLSFVAHLSPRKVLLVGVLPFLPGDVLKAAASIFVFQKIGKHLRTFARTEAR